MDGSKMENSQVLSKIVKTPGFLENLYDVIREVDPIQKEVRSYSKSEHSLIQSFPHDCFGLWDNNMVCENCISMRALNQKRATVKLEYRDARIYLVTAVPFTGDDNKLTVVELLKDITNDGIINIDGLGQTEMSKLINKKNEAIIKDALTVAYNEQFIFERLPHDLLTVEKKGMKLALFLIKIANIEAITNAYGNGVKGNTIKEIARIMQQIPYKSNDWAARYREAAFILVIHEMNEKKANRLCRRIHNKISGHKFGSLPKHLDIEINIGYHVVMNADKKPEKIIENANKMLTASRTISIKSRFTKKYDKFFNKYLLTLREREVALLLSTGNSNNAIAEKIFVGLSTVKKHVSSIFNKTNTKSRAELIAKLAIVEVP